MLKIWAKRHRDLARARNQACCRLHAVLRPGARRHPPGDQRREGRPDPRAGHPLEPGCQGTLRAGRRVPGRPPPPGRPAARGQQEAGRRGSGLGHQPDRPVRCRPGDRRHRDRRRAPGIPVPGPGSLRLLERHRPVEVSSGDRKKVYRLSLRGNRRVNHAIHMAAISQIRHKRSEGRAFYEKKVAEGKTHKEALRALKRRISDAIYAALVADARQATACREGPGGQPGNHSASRAAGSHPEHRHFGQATPRPRNHTTAADSIPGRAGHSPVAATLPSAKPQVQAERPQRSEDERPGVRRGDGHTRPRGRPRSDPPARL